MFFNNVVPIVVVVAILLAGIIYRQAVLVPRQKARLADQLAREQFNTEMARIEGLPKLNTQWLTRVPEKLMDKSPIRRSYGTRYNRTLIIDEQGCGWVGLVIPEILESLTAGEYVWRDYHIPFRGAGEAYTGNAVTIDGWRIDIYPMWMTEGVNTPEWNLWARIEKNFTDRSRGWNYQSGLRKLNEHMQEFREKRANFNRLATAAKMEAAK